MYSAGNIVLLRFDFSGLHHPLNHNAVIMYIWTEFLCQSDFTWNQGLQIYSVKICNSKSFWGSEIWFLWFSLYLWRLKLTKYSKFRAHKIGKRRIQNFWILQDWFHVNSEWQKNPEISTLSKFAWRKKFQIHQHSGHTLLRSEERLKYQHCM